MKTSLDTVESQSFECFKNFTVNTLLGAGVSGVFAIFFLKNKCNFMLYGAGTGGGVAVYKCDLAFQSLEMPKQCYPDEAFKWQEALLMMGKILNG